MPPTNLSVATPDFFLMGFPGLEAYYVWLSVPFLVMYSVAVVGNIIILCVVKLEESLHTPMFSFLCVLALIDLGLCTSTIPKMLQMFWLRANVISFQACFVQMFVIHFLSSLESSTLAVMAYDRYVAIYNPLRYTTILTNAYIIKIVAVLFVRGFILTGLIPVLASRLPFCSSTIISHCFCDHMAVVKLACTDITINSYYGLAAAFFVIGTDLFFIIFTYVMIMRAVLKLASKTARLKAFNTCGSHLFVILYFYTTMLFSFITYRFGQSVPAHVHATFTVLYLLVPPMLNPVIYGVRTKEIREGFLKHLFGKKIKPKTEHLNIKDNREPYVNET
ncbi:olfactory receptor 52E4-like [Erpetoichthys calabaricus]|uniref:olfactory receptor 52E4-like n=1 Tax=Erpetoichthys calabaricus TaxID=27687 RepID=UPI00223406C5|nr:olfactory receptor 52E4-like [Erpetoichthys calabaricus]